MSVTGSLISDLPVTILSNARLGVGVDAYVGRHSFLPNCKLQGLAKLQYAGGLLPKTAVLTYFVLSARGAACLVCGHRIPQFP